MTNGAIIQFFHWYVPRDGSFWNHLKDQAAFLSSLGLTAVWIPPAHKGKDGPNSSGYDLYDLYDLGEFDQKGSVRTRYGTAKELFAAIRALKENNLQLYADIVLNHMGGADETEKITVKKVNEHNRNEFISEPFEIEAYTRFTFPGRKGKYSKFIWDHQCFTGVDYAHDQQESAIFSIMNEYGEGWEHVIDTEKGNYDYLMFCDVEHRNKEVRRELKRFGKWMLKKTGFDGVRLDAVKHIAPQFLVVWLDYMRTLKPDLFAVGEYWAPGDTALLLHYLETVGDRMSLFDASLHHNFFHASNAGEAYDLRTILDNSLVKIKPDKAVTVVDNHDTQPLQALEAPVEAWFKPLAYALILLRSEGYPCVFYPDLYGAHYRDKGRDGNEHEIFLDKCDGLENLLRARATYAYGLQRDFFQEMNCIGWTREGIDENPDSGCAVVLSNGAEASLHMEIGQKHAGAEFTDLMGKRTEIVRIDENGFAGFPVNGGSVSVWVKKVQ